jgi:hypothetical protein
MMSALKGGGSADVTHESVVMLVRTVPVRLVEVSRGGCRFESPARLEPGLSGQLAVQLEGAARIDDIRVARCQQRVGGNGTYQIGAELLKTRRLGKRSVRLAVRKIISEQVRDTGHVPGSTPAPASQEPWTGESGLRLVGRAPPPHPERGS